MARTNTVAVNPRKTHEGATAHPINAVQELRRAVMACMLFEDTFYESGICIAGRISMLVKKVRPEDLSKIAIEARSQYNLRHVPLLLARELARHPDIKSNPSIVSRTIEQVIQRADELAEFVALYWQQKKQPLSAQVKKGLANAFRKFNAHQLAKYNRGNVVKLRDVLFLCHAKPKDEVQAQDWKQLVDGTLPIPDTWETQLSAGADKAETFTRLMAQEKLGGLAYLRNLRNMEQAGVPKDVVRAYSEKAKLDRILPFRFIAAARAVPGWEDIIEPMMLRSLLRAEKLPGRTVIVVDNSGSMTGRNVSAKSDVDRSDAACALAILLREICDDCTVIAYATEAAIIPPRRGFALADAIKKGPSGGTNTARALALANKQEYDRIIVITDEQSNTAIDSPRAHSIGYFINVATYRNGIGYGAWNHIDGFSESVIEWMRQFEKDNAENL